MTDEYKPISCDLHSQYELWIMRGQDIKLAWQDETGITHIERVKPVDVRAESGYEFLYFKDSRQSHGRVRLDYILRADPHVSQAQ
jgi:Rho-binding antiterminator